MCNGLGIIVLRKGEELQIFGKAGNKHHDIVLSELVPVEDHNDVIKLEYIYPGLLRLDAPDEECREAALKTGLVKETGLGKVIALDPKIGAQVLAWIAVHPEMQQFPKTLLQEAYLSRADLSRADLSGADLSRANLYWADLSGADLSGADLSWSNLSGADLSWSNLSWSNLSRANLSRANLSWADLSGANLYGADLSKANLRDGQFSNYTLNSLKDARNISDAKLSQAIIDALKATDPKA